MSTYTALVSRDGKFWHIDVPEIDRVTQARTINEVEDMARDLIAIMKKSMRPSWPTSGRRSPSWRRRSPR